MQQTHSISVMKNQSLTAPYGNTRYLFQNTYNTYNSTVWAECRIF